MHNSGFRHPFGNDVTLKRRLSAPITRVVTTTALALPLAALGGCGMSSLTSGLVDAGPNKPNVLGTFQQEDSLLEFDVTRSTLAFQRIYEPDTSERFLTGCRHLV